MRRRPASRAFRSAPTITSPSRSSRASSCFASAISSSAPRRRYIFHIERSELRQGEEIIHLTDREREMLRILASAPGETVPRAELTSGGTVNERAVDVQINRLRRKIEHDPANPLFLQAVRGIGYRLVASP